MRTNQLLSVVIGFVLCLSVSAYAEEKTPGSQDSEKKDYYVGAAGSWGYDAFQSAYNFDDATGFNLKLAMYMDIYYSEALELDINHVGPFKRKPNGLTEIDVTTYVLAMRHDLNPQKKVKLYITWGFGYMVADVDGAYATPGIDGSDSGLCLKMSLGTDFFLTDSVALGFEAATYPGFGDVHEFSYYNMALGVKYFF